MTKLKETLRAIENGDSDALWQLFLAGELEDASEDDRLQITRLAAGEGQAEILKDLFTHYHLYSTETDAAGRTLLHDAAASGDPETIAFAVDVAGLDPLEGDAAGRTPLDEAAEAENPAGYTWLKKRLGFGPEDCYRNPVIRGFHPDPSVVRVGEDYYLVNSSFVCFPGLPVFHSRDLVHWRLIGHAADNLEKSGLQGLPGGFGYWAPDISWWHGRFWVVATLRRNTPPYRLQMLTWADRPEGPWAEPKFLPLDGIDPSLFAEGDRRYILLNPGAIMAEISEEGEILSEPEMIFFGDARIKPEGPHLLKKDGWYYLFLAEGGTGDGHMETVMRSRSLKGPYEACPFNPILGRKKPDAYIQRSGHGKPVSTPDGRWYMVYLCGRKADGKTVMGRETALDPMEWTADGWPMVNRLKGPSCLQRAPFGNAEQIPGPEQKDWIAPRTDPRSFARISGSRMTLRCGADPAGTGPCSLLLCRQRELDFFQSVQADLSGCEEGSSAGIAGYYDERSFFLFTARRAGYGLQVEVTEQTGEERTVRELMTVTGVTAELAVSGNGVLRKLMIRSGGGWEYLCSLEADYLSDEGITGGKRFTGALLGLAAVGAGEAAFLNHTVHFNRGETAG